MARESEKSGFRTIVLEWDLITSDVFHALGRAAIRVLLIFMSKRRMKQDSTRQRRWVITNNGEIEFTYVEAHGKWGIPRSTFQRALNELVEKGLIDIRVRGAGTHGSPNLYAISERWRKWGTDRFETARLPAKRNQRGFAPGHPFYPSC